MAAQPSRAHSSKNERSATNQSPMVAGPSTEAVADDPEGAEVLAEVLEARDALPASVRDRVYLASRPMEDREQNAEDVLLCRRGESLYAIGNRCTHLGAPLHRGPVKSLGSIITVTSR